MSTHDDAKKYLQSLIREGFIPAPVVCAAARRDRHRRHVPTASDLNWTMDATEEMQKRFEIKDEDVPTDAEVVELTSPEATGTASRYVIRCGKKYFYDFKNERPLFIHSFERGTSYWLYDANALIHLLLHRFGIQNAELVLAPVQKEQAL